MKIEIPISSYESIKVIPDGKCPHPRYTIQDKTEDMFLTGFKDTIILKGTCQGSTYNHTFLGREVKRLPDVLQNTLFSIFHKNSIVSESNINIDSALQILNTYMFPKLDNIECSICSTDDKHVIVNEEGVFSFFRKAEFWSNPNMLYLHNIVETVCNRYEKIGIQVDGISLHVCGNYFTNIYKPNVKYRLYEGISRVYKDYFNQNSPATKDSYMIDYILYVEPTKTTENLRKFAFDYSAKSGVSTAVNLNEVVKMLKSSISEVSQVTTKVELNKIFTVVKNGIEYKWKVIKHPYFDEELTLVRDYRGMINGVCDKDYNHVYGKTTLDTAYKDAFVLS